MKTKLISITLILVIFIPQSFSQKRPNLDTGVHFGIIAGMTLQSIYGTDFWGDKLDYDLVPGWRFGGNVNIPIAADIYIQPGLMFCGNGARQNVLESPTKAEGLEVTTTIRLNYIEVPVNLLFRPQIGDGHLLLGFGPYVGYGLFGKVKSSSGSYSSEVDIKFRNKVTASDLSSAAYFRPLDAGGTIMVGYELFGGLFFQINSQLGLLKVNPEYESLTDNKTSMKNIGFGISAGYRF
jgi:hypothetical protein